MVLQEKGIDFWVSSKGVTRKKSENTIEKEQETTVSRYLWSILYYTNALGSVTKRPTIPESIEDL